MYPYDECRIAYQSDTIQLHVSHQSEPYTGVLDMSRQTVTHFHSGGGDGASISPCGMVDHNGREAGVPAAAWLPDGRSFCVIDPCLPVNAADAAAMPPEFYPSLSHSLTPTPYFQPETTGERPMESARYGGVRVMDFCRGPQSPCHVNGAVIIDGADVSDRPGEHRTSNLCDARLALSGLSVGEPLLLGRCTSADMID